MIYKRIFLFYANLIIFIENTKYAYNKKRL